MDLRAQLAAGPAYGVWSTLADPVGLAAFLVDGVDYVVLDLQHGSADERDLPALTSTAVSRGVAPLVRVRAPVPTYVSRALDLGAHGVVVPHVDNPAIAADAVAACRYPPDGRRSFGRAVGGSDEPLCVVMVESAAALDAVDDILTVPGVDAVYVGPWDLSLSLGCSPDPADPVLAGALARVRDAAERAGKPAGIHAADGSTARAHAAAGCRLVTVVTDTSLLGAGARVALAAALDSRA